MTQQLKTLGYLRRPDLWALSEAGFKLDPWQVDILRGGRKIAVLAPRQSGKSACASIEAVFDATIRNPGRSVVVLLGVSERQARLLLKRCKDFIRLLSPEFRPKIEQQSESRLVLENGSEIHAVPTGVDGQADGIRGFSATCVIIDEAAFALVDGPDGSGIPLLMAVAPMLNAAPGGGRLIGISSAGFEGSPFYRICEEAEGGWDVVKISIDQCPRLTSDILEELKGTLGEQGYKREMMLEWVGNDVMVLSPESARAAMSDGETADVATLMMI